jgi:hypothetical protein
MFIKKIMTLGFVILLAGCQSTLMEPVTEQVSTNVEQGSSRVVFIRSAFVGQAIQASVFEIKNGVPEFIGISSNDTKISFDTTPGEHMFMVVGESADFLKAELTEGKTYYSVVSPRMGFWKARFSLHPVRNTEATKFKYDSKEFLEMQTDSRFVKSGVKAEGWAIKNANSINKKLSSYLPKWQQKANEKQLEATINKEDFLQ